MSKKIHTCCICLEDTKNYDAFYTPCLHRFHTDCINKWLEQKKYCQKVDCPTCRTDIGILLGENREIRPPEQDESADIEAIISLLNADLSELYDTPSIESSYRIISPFSIIRNRAPNGFNPERLLQHMNPASVAMNIGDTLTDALISTLLTSVVNSFNGPRQPV